MAKLELHNWYRQYQKLKAQAPGAILFFRFGDFYETFDDDAKLIAELMDVTLTRKDYAVDKSKPKEQQKLYAPMAGMPYRAVERYVTELVSRGYRIAIAEQLSETESSKSDTRPRSVYAGGLEQTARESAMVHREIVRVITPGTLVDPSLLPTGQNNYLAAVLAENGRIGLAYADLSTGEFAATEFNGERAATQFEGELARLQAAEVLVPDEPALRLPGMEPGAARLSQDLAPMTKDEREHLLPHERIARRLERESTARWTNGRVTATATWRWDADTARESLLRQFRTHSLGSFGLEGKPLAMRAAGALLQYAQETQRNSSSQITSMRAYTTGGFMFLDPQTRRNLELLESTSSGKAKGSLVGVLDRTRSPMGARLLRRWVSQPLLNLAALHVRQEGVACCVDDSMLRASLRQALSEVGDMERAVNRIAQGTTTATPRDLVQLRMALRALPAVIAAAGSALPTLIAEETGDRRPETGATQTGDGRPFDFAQGRPETGVPQTGDRRPETEGRVSESRGTRQSSIVNRQSSIVNRPAPRVASDDLFGDEEDPRSENPQPRTGKDVGANLVFAQPENQERGLKSALPIEPTHDSLNAQCSTPHSLDPCADLLALLERALDDDPPALLGASNYLKSDEGGEKPRRVIRPGYEPRMDGLVKANRDAQAFIDSLEDREKTRTGIKNLKVSHNSVFGYYIEVSRSNADQVPSHYERKQTLVGAERYITSELKEYERVVDNAKLRLLELEREAFARICEEIAAHTSRLLAAARAVARIDVYAALAEAAVRGRYVRPTLTDSTRLRIVGGRHPVVEQVLDEEFIPNDVALDTDESQLLLITGPNMAGKSTVLRQVALTVLLAQIGAFVPAEEAEVGLVDRIFTRIGAQDDIATGQSTFMVEMTETAALLLQSTRRSLIILDEVGRGTSTYDGMAIARAVVEYIHNEPRLQCRTLFATHYHELIALEGLLPRVRNFHMAAIEQEGHVVFLHELRQGGADRSYGIHVAELAGIPRPVIRRASELLAELEGQRREPRTPPSIPPHAGGGQNPEPRTENPVLTGGANGVPSNGKQASGQPAAPNGQLSLFDIAPNPVVEYLKRLNINELTPLEALTKLYELQKIANRPMPEVE
ncbi:MAG: DNA mismatch repair protein MutS [Chloroflexaceae bacterium]|jgi:DNA mismatch repair protein MutS|nr:DNA mismatch repair protein MutS [Chloroflexaceae bacterium]